ncbi:hypothetical protein QFA96_16445 [Pseudomonas sp. Ap32]|nr:hypothetical protein QFA96_16445 [Pseudomonas sp. Ap32]
MERLLLYAQAGFNELQNQFLTEALDQYSVMLKQSITRKDGGYANWALDKQQGRIAEAHHAGSYNIEAAGKGANNHRATLDVGRHNDPVHHAVELRALERKQHATEKLSELITRYDYVLIDMNGATELVRRFADVVAVVIDTKCTMSVRAAGNFVSDLREI